MKILIDMNLPRRWVEVFAKADWEAVHWSQLGAPTASDREIMTWAREMAMRYLPMTSIFPPYWRLHKEKNRV